MQRDERKDGSGLEVRLLGPLEALRAGSSVALGGPKARTLLASLALDVGRAVSVDLLVEALWPGEVPETAAHAVQVYVSQLRKALGAETVVRTGPGYALELDPERVDLRRFARLVGEGRELLAGGGAAGATTVLREALGLWRGPALADFVYEPFAQTEIARLEELRQDAVEARIDADLALGRHTELVPELEALVHAHPLREHPRAQLMLALYRSGRQADALAAYRLARETLVEELGIDPGPELRELEAAILRQDESLLLPEIAPPQAEMQFRRLVTIMFVDIVESMRLAEAFDAEALGVVLGRYFDTVSEALRAHGGTVEKYAGDAVMAVFGIPVSYEDHALRAARAAVDVRAGVSALRDALLSEHGVGLDVRVGIEAGEVVAQQSAARQRLVTGEAVGLAAKLEQAAEANTIVVGPVAARLVDHEAVLEPLVPIAIKGRRESVAAYRLGELTGPALAFERTLEAALVGRRRELAALRKALRRAGADGSARVSVVIGPPGVGKSRLAAELARRAKGLTTLWGRCLSYGDGITFWPLREAVAQAPESEEREAFLAALDADTPPSAAEIGLAFRQLCESLARERPLLVVFDDVHWAEPTLLEVIEGVAERGAGPIHLVCVAREELLEHAPAFLEGSEAAERIVLDALSTGEAEALLDRLGAGALESDQRDRIVAAAEGNPFFLEQLLALALEGGLAEQALPATVQALLAARLDRLGPGERAVLERGAVAGKEFRADDVGALLEPAAVPTLETHLRVLAERGFVRPLREGAFAFRHVLVQEAVYRSAPKRLRAELHERYADRLDLAYPELPELDEFVGYHLEQAYRLRTELGESDRRAAQLAEDGGRRLGGAGIRAVMRGDMHASRSLLDRAAALLPPCSQARRLLLCDLGLTLHAQGETTKALAILKDAITESSAASDRHVEAWARIEFEYMRLRSEPGRTADDLLAAADVAIPTLESIGDQRAIARAWVLVGWVRGGRRGDHNAWQMAAERALVHFKAAGWSTSTCVGQIAGALHYGPTPARDAIDRCEELLHKDVTDRPGSAYVTTFLGGLVAQQGDFDRARELVRSAREALLDLGLRAQAVGYCGPVLAEVELLAGNLAEAVALWRDLCEEFGRTSQVSSLASYGGELAEALVADGAFDEGQKWAEIAESQTASDDLHAQTRWRPVRALIHAHLGDVPLAVRLGREAASLTDATDDLNRRAKAHRSLGEILKFAGRTHEATAEFECAINLYRRKGNVPGVAQVQSLQHELTPV